MTRGFRIVRFLTLLSLHAAVTWAQEGQVTVLSTGGRVRAESYCTVQDCTLGIVENRCPGPECSLSIPAGSFRPALVFNGSAALDASIAHGLRSTTISIAASGSAMYVPSRPGQQALANASYGAGFAVLVYAALPPGTPVRMGLTGNVSTNVEGNRFSTASSFAGLDRGGAFNPSNPTRIVTATDERVTTPSGTFFFLDRLVVTGHASVDGGDGLPHQSAFDATVSLTVTTDQGRPDLVVVTISTLGGTDGDVASVQPGGSLVLFDIVRNAGDSSADPSMTAYRLRRESTDVPLSPAGSVPGLERGSQSSAIRQVLVPDNLDLGEYSLIACADATQVVTELNETNNCTVSGVRIAVDLPAPSVELLLPSDGEMASMYELKARLTNNANQAIVVRLPWQEQYTFPQLSPAPATGSVDVELAAGETKTVLLGRFSYKWDWIDPENPIDVLRETLPDAFRGLSVEALEEALRLLRAGNLLTFVRAIQPIVLLAEGLQTIQTVTHPTTTVFYRSTPRYGRISDAELTRQVPLIQRSITLHVPSFKIAALGEFAFFSVAAAVSTDAGIAALFVPPIGLGFSAATAAFVAQAQMIEIATLNYDIARDPATPDYTEIAAPVRRAIPELDALPPGPLKSFALSIQELHALKEAQRISLDRADGAFADGAPEWESVQVRAAMQYALEASSATTRAIGLAGLIEPQLANLLAEHGDEAPGFLQTNGIPEIEKSYLEAAGWSAQDLASLRDALLAIPRPVPAAMLGTNLKAGALLSAGVGLGLSSRLTALRADRLGQEVRDLTLAERQALDLARAAIEARMTDPAPSPVTPALVESLIENVMTLLDRTNNAAALMGDLDFALLAQGRFQQLDFTPAGIVAVIERLGGTEIPHDGIMNSLRAKLRAAQARLASGDFDAASGLVGAFLNEVAAQRGKKIPAGTADLLTAYGAYLQDLVRHKR